jgi:hypothetical protein
MVTLTARTNTGYRINYWQGADSATGTSAQVAMNGYRLVEANFMPATYPYLVVTDNGGAAPGQLIGNIGGRTAGNRRLCHPGHRRMPCSPARPIRPQICHPPGFDASEQR